MKHVKICKPRGSDQKKRPKNKLTSDGEGQSPKKEKTVFSAEGFTCIPVGTIVDRD